MSLTRLDSSQVGVLIAGVLLIVAILDETASCSEEVIFGDFGIARQLQAFTTTVVEFTPDKVGEFTFTCGMNRVRRKLIVEPA